VYAGCTYLDEVERSAINLAKQLFAAQFVDVRPVSGVNSNLISYTAFGRPGDTVMALSIPNGGHISYGKLELGGTAGAVRGLDVQYFPFDPDSMNIDVDKTKTKVQKLISEGKTPKMAIFGASVFLFPHPLKELESFFHSLNAIIMYDSAHVLGLIAGKRFQDPLREGADVVTGSTHKTLPGPQGGIILSWEKYADVLKKAAFPSNLSNHHLHSVAGKAVAFCEMLAFGEEYASNVIRNAKAFAESLASKGFKVLGEKMGYTDSHQVIVDVSMYRGGGILEKELERANIIANRNMIHDDIKANRHYDNPGGLRFGVQELTRLGMGPQEMMVIADFIADVIIRFKSSQEIAKKVSEFRSQFRKLKYTFDLNEAYTYFQLRR
jgi:glycine hydroxymethyltransferase